MDGDAEGNILCNLFLFSLLHTTTDLSDQECPAQKYYVQEYFLEPLLVFTIIEHTRTTNACTPICNCLHWTKAPAYLLEHHCNSMQCNDCMHSHHFHCNGRFCSCTALKLNTLGANLCTWKYSVQWKLDRTQGAALFIWQCKIAQIYTMYCTVKLAM